MQTFGAVIIISYRFNKLYQQGSNQNGLSSCLASKSQCQDADRRQTAQNQSDDQLEFCQGLSLVSKKMCQEIKIRGNQLILS